MQTVAAETAIVVTISLRVSKQRQSTTNEPNLTPAITTRVSTRLFGYLVSAEGRCHAA
jgi:hypothetical protein